MPVTLDFLENNIAIIKIDRPEVRNALDWEAMYRFRDLIDEAHNIKNLPALIITGANNTFIAGGDLKALHKHTSEEDGQLLSQIMSSALARLETLPCPTIAAINGPARGGGAEICLACDIRIMESDADIGFVQIKLGIIPGWGAGQRLLSTVGYSRAIELLISGNAIGADKAKLIGLVNQITAPGEAEMIAITLARMIADQPINAIQAIKRILRAGLYLPKETSIALEQAEFPPLWASDEHTEAVKKFLNRKI